MWETATTVPDINNVEAQVEMRAQLRVPADLPLRNNPLHNSTDCLVNPTAGLDSDCKVEIVLTSSSVVTPVARHYNY